ncbi:MAG: hypothetical protein WA324_08635 [Bryobacteraceae bacterium]
MSGENGDRESRMDRIERALDLFVADHEQFHQEHKQLLAAQVLQQDALDKQLKMTQALTLQIERLGLQSQERNEALGLRFEKMISAIGELCRRLQA